MCPWKPPKQTENENYVWYSYRKYRALCNHIFTEHTRDQALKYRRIAAEEKRLQDASKRPRPRKGVIHLKKRGEGSYG